MGAKYESERNVTRRTNTKYRDKPGNYKGVKMSVLITDDEYSKDIIVAEVELNGGDSQVQHKSTGIGKRGKWVITIAWLDELEGLKFMKTLREYPNLHYDYK